MSEGKRWIRRSDTNRVFDVMLGEEKIGEIDEKTWRWADRDCLQRCTDEIVERHLEAKGQSEAPAREEYDRRVAGFRTWLVSPEQRLMSPHFADAATWTPGRQKAAKCAGNAHAAPGRGCRCGLYAFYTFEEWEAQEAGFCFREFNPAVSVVGIGSASGRTILQERGFRAGFMRVEAFIAYRATYRALGSELSMRPALEALGKVYGVPVIDPVDIAAFCEIEDLEQIEPMECQPSQIEGSGHGYYALTSAFNGIAVAAQQFSQALQISAPPKPTNMQEVIEQKKSNQKFYADLVNRSPMTKRNVNPYRNGGGKLNGK